MGTLHIHQRAQHVEEAIEATMGDAAVVALGTDRLSRRELVEWAWLARPRRLRVGSLGERLLIDAVADEAEGVLAALRGMRGFADGLRRIVSAWKQAGLSPKDVARVASRLGGPAERLKELARLYRRYSVRLGERADEADVLRGAIDSIRSGDPIAVLVGVDRVIVHEAVDLAAPWIELLRALASRGLSVEARLPLLDDGFHVRRPLLERPIEEIEAAFQRDEGVMLELLHHPLTAGPAGVVARDEGDASPRERLLARLFRARNGGREEAEHKVAGAPITLTAAASPEVEARAIARRARDLLDEGVAPDAIAIVSRDSSERDRVAGWLSRYRVPFVASAGRTAASATPVRIALRLFDLVDDGVPREGLIALLSSRYVSPMRGPGERWIPPHRIARFLRAAGVRDATDEEGVPGYRRRLAELARADEPHRAEIERVSAHVDAILSLLSSLSDDATLAEHAASFGRVVERLGIELQSRGFTTTGEAGLDDAERVARDQASVAALRRHLAELPRAAVRAGLDAVRIPRTRFARLLESVLSSESVRPGGARGGAVELGEPESVIGRRFEHLLYLGLVDGVVPARSGDDPLLSDAERFAFNRHLDAEVLPTSARADAAEPLTFLRVLCAGDHLHLAWPLADGDGRPILRSPYLDEVERAAAVPILRPDHDPIPRAADARLPSELLARSALEADALPEGRLAPPDPDLGPHLAAAARARFSAAASAASAVAAIERARLDFFDGKNDGTGPLGRFVGNIGDPVLRAALADKLPGRAERPLSASAVEDYGRCGFRFFVSRLLGADSPEEMGDDLDPRAGGRLHHRILETFFRRLGDSGRLPLRGDERERHLLDEACDEVLREWTEKEQRGHPALFTARAKKTRRDLGVLVAAEAVNEHFQGSRPTHFEHAFTVAIPPPPGGDSERAPLHIRGKIDRIDVSLGGDTAVVLDYKSGGASGLAKLLKDDALLSTSFQLPLYAAAAQSIFGFGAVSARYYSMRDAKLSAALDDPDLIAIDPAARAGAAKNVADELWRMWDRMRGGDFRITPKSCDFCTLGAACRVVLRRSKDDGSEA